MTEVGPIDVEKLADGVRLTATWNVRFPHKNLFLAYLDSLEHYEMIEDVRLIRMQENYALLKTTWVNADSSYHKVFTQKCLFTSPVTQEQGYEKYTIITDDPAEVKQLLAQLDEIGHAKLFSVGTVDEDRNTFSLTKKQLGAVIIALNHGYYEWPKKSNLSDIAKMTGMNRRTLQDNLRRAEAQIFSSIRAELFSGGDAM